MSRARLGAGPAAVLAAALLTLGGWGCEDNDVGKSGTPDADTDTDTDGDVDGDADGDADGDTDGDADGDSDADEGCDKMDILFVIDNSGSMSEEQTNLIANFEGFIQAIEEYEVLGSSGGQLDYHVGVTSTGVDHNDCAPLIGCTLEEEEDGVLQNTPLGNGGSCTPPTLRYMEGPGDWVADEFACVAELGTSGFSEEMPLEALRRSMTHGLEGFDYLDGHVDEENAGFLRDDALFVALFITDEDDQSRANTYPADFAEDFSWEDNLGPLEDYIDAYLDIKPSYEYMVFGVIAGPPDESCTSDFGGASDASRLHEFIEMVGDNAATADICDEDLAGAFATMLDTIELACDEMPPIE